MARFDFIVRIARAVFARRTDFVIPVVAFAVDHRVAMVAIFAAIVAIYFIVDAIFDVRHWLNQCRTSFLGWFRIAAIIPVL